MIKFGFDFIRLRRLLLRVTDQWETWLGEKSLVAAAADADRKSSGTNPEENTSRCSGRARSERQIQVEVTVQTQASRALPTVEAHIHVGCDDEV